MGNPDKIPDKTGRNKGGRPKGSLNKVGADVRALAQQHTEMALKTLKTIADDDKAPAAARVSAANSLLDRAHGKVSTVEVTAGDGGKVVIEIVA